MAELQVADLLANGPRDCAELAAPVGTHPPSLHWLLRSLVNVGLFGAAGFRLARLLPTGGETPELHLALLRGQPRAPGLPPLASGEVLRTNSGFVHVGTSSPANLSAPFSASSKAS
jgi:hypothetical protein